MAVQVLPLEEAISRISGKTPIGSVLRSAEWAQVPQFLRDRAFFSAGIESVRLLDAMQGKLLQSVSLLREQVRNGEALVDRSSFIADMRKIAREEGIFVDPLKKGGLQDITSRRRLGMVWDIQEEMAREYARWKAEQDPDVLAAFPAQELVRLEAREVPRKWLERWTQAGGRLIDGRMIALKGDPIWRRISRFGLPFPPFDFNSGMGLVDHDREAAEAWGLLGPGDEVVPAEAGFNDALQASIRDLQNKPKLRQALEHFFGDQISIDGDVVHWRGQQPVPTPLATVPATSLAELRTVMERISASQTAKQAELTRALAADPDRVQQLAEEIEALREKARDAASVPLVERGRVTFVNRPHPSIARNIAAGAGIVERFVDSTLLPKGIRVRKINGRAKYRSRTKEIFLSQWDPADVTAHEIVHDIEFRHASVADLTADFLMRRSEGRPPVSLRQLTGNRGYDASEVAYEDQWAQRGGSVYSGKLYPGAPTEILTMGIQRLQADPVAFFERDPEYFEFVVSTLRKW